MLSTLLSWQKETYLLVVYMRLEMKMVQNIYESYYLDKWIQRAEYERHVNQC